MMFIRLLYGSGLRLMECVRLRVKDLDFAQLQVLVRDGKGEKDRETMLPESLVSPLQDHLRIVKRTHEEDLAKGYGAVYLPYALEHKYPQRGARVALAIRLSCQSPFGRPAQWRRPPPSYPRKQSAKSRARRSPGDGNSQTD